MSAFIKNNILHKPILKGYPFEIKLRGPAGYMALFTTIRADFKSSKTLDSPTVLSYSLGAGIAVDGNDMILTITKEVTANIRQGFLLADIKAAVGSGDPVLLLDGYFEVIEKATL